MILHRKKNPLRLTPGMMIKRGHYAYFFFYWLYTVYWDRKIGKRSMERTVFNIDEEKYPVQCISYPYLRELVKCISVTEEDVFVDVGCAWGRLLGYLKYHTPARKWIGVEYNEEAGKTAEETFAGDETVEIVKGDILKNIPEDGTIFYLFNPFGKNILEQFLERLEKTEKQNVKIYYLHPVWKEVFEERKNRWVLKEERILKPRYLGPLNLLKYELIIEESVTRGAKEDEFL